MKKTQKFALSVVAALFFLFINILEVKSYLKLPTTWPHRFCADKGQFWTYQKGKGRNTYGSVLFAFDLYKKDVNKPDLVLHRRFQKEWWQIWNWLEYLFAPYWACPYAATDEES